jgi:hypothetical protein
MPEGAPRPAQAAIHTDLGAIFVSMELSRRAWLITSLSPGGGAKLSKHSVPASDVSVSRFDRIPILIEAIERIFAQQSFHPNLPEAGARKHLP